MYIFEIERDEEILRLEQERHDARQMALKIHTRSRQQSEQWLNSLVNLNRRIANLDSADAILAQVVKIARALLSADSAVLALAEENGQDLVPRFQATLHGVQEVDGTPLTDQLFQPVMVNGASLRVPEDLPGTALTWSLSGRVQSAEQAAIVPLRLNQQTIGVLWVGRRAGGEGFSCTDLISLSHLANQAVIALEHSLMAARLQSLAVTEERSRIAREMHDSLAQILGYLGLETQTLEALVRQGETEAVLGELKQARTMIKSAQLDVRESILSLRTTLSGEISLRDALREYVQEFGIQTGMVAHFCDDVGESMPLSPLAETQCVRIVQEALTNVRKHAQASCVDVTLFDQDGWLRVHVKDDGVGLPQMPVPAHHYGLQTMRERAESVGGSLNIQSMPSEGTEVQLCLPLL
jgi:signal transduction histidine kinase